MGGFWFLNGWGRDVRYALRQLSKSPGITSIAVMTLALGIGANTAVFTLTWQVILKSLPVSRPDRLVEYEMWDGTHMLGLSGPEYTALRQRQHVCIDLLAWASDEATVRTRQLGEKRTRIQLLSGSAFHVLEMKPYLGSLFMENADTEEGPHGIPAVLSYEYWREQFHGDAGALGQTLMVENHAVTVIGILPKTFEGLTANFHPALYLPFSFSDLLYGSDFRRDPGHFAHFVLGRLKPGMDLAAADAELKAIEPSIRHEADPSGNYLRKFLKFYRLRVQSGRSGVSWVKATYTKQLLVVEMLVTFLLVLCCLNTALVMLALVSDRQREYAIRSALGARWLRLIRQVLVETIMLTIPGLLLGGLLGWSAARVLVAMLGTMGGASSMDVRPNLIILSFNVGLSLIVAIAAGLWPALRAAKAAPALDLKDRGITAKGIGGSAVVLQVAVSVSLMTSALLMGSTLQTLLTNRAGIDAAGTGMAFIDFRPAKQQPKETAAMVGELLQKIQHAPGVTAAGITAMRPLIGFSTASPQFAFDQVGNIRSEPRALSVQVSPDYFKAIGTGLLSGSSEASMSTGSMPQCVISQNLAEAFFPKNSAVDRIVYSSTLGQPDGTDLDPKSACHVVGVAEDARLVSLRVPPPRTVYDLISPSQSIGDTPNILSGPVVNVIVRANTYALANVALQDSVRQALPGSVEVKFQTLEQSVSDDLNRERMLVSMSGTFALLALLLTVLGIYGLLMRSVALRTKEIGIRVSLGAQRNQIVTAIAKKTLVEIGAGLLAGAAMTTILVKIIHRLLVEPQPSAVWVYAISSGVILLVAGAAMYFPAKRAVSVDPVCALRTE